MPLASCETTVVYLALNRMYVLAPNVKPFLYLQERAKAVSVAHCYGADFARNRNFHDLVVVGILDQAVCQARLLVDTGPFFEDDLANALELHAAPAL